MKRTTCSPLLTSLWLLLLFGVTACDRAEDLSDCPKACVQGGDKVASLGLYKDTWRVYPPKATSASFSSPDLSKALVALTEEQNKQSRGLAVQRALYVRCDNESSPEMLAVLLRGVGENYTVLGLGGLHNGEVSYATMGIWRGERLQKALDLHQVVRFKDASATCTPGGVKTCPIVLSSLQESSCGALMRRIEDLHARRQLSGILVE